MTILPFGGGIEVSASTKFNYTWLYTGNPIDTRIHVTAATPQENYPFLKGKLSETKGWGHERAYEIWTDERAPDGGWSATDDVHIHENSSEGESKTICSGETVNVKTHDRYYGTWYFQTRTLRHKGTDVMHFWFCPKKSYLDNLGLDDKYVAVFLKVRNRYKDYRWYSGNRLHWETGAASVEITAPIPMLHRNLQQKQKK